MPFSALLRLLLALLLALAPAAAAAFERVGVVLLHGKTGSPAQFTVLAADLEDMGFAVEAPEMCWSGRRIYDRSITACPDDVDAAIARLRADGITRIVVAGHSLGGVGALLYGATHDGLAGIIALAPAGDPPAAAKGATLAKSLAAARAAAKAGNGDTVATYADVVLGRALPVTATAADFLSFFGPDSPGAMARTLPALRAPLLWVAGTRDGSQKNAGDRFRTAPAHPENRFVTVKADHLGTPSAAFGPMVDWLQALETE